MQNVGQNQCNVDLVCNKVLFDKRVTLIVAFKVFLVLTKRVFKEFIS